MKKYPKVAVAIILRYKDRILILKHENGALKFPGGKMDMIKIEANYIRAIYTKYKFI